MPATTAEVCSEFIGTFLLVFTVGCNVLAGSGVWAATSIACVLMVGIYALGSASGAHFNPAVTFALAISGKMNNEDNKGVNWAKAGVYIVVQLLAGIIAALCYGAVFGRSFNLQPGKGFGALEAGIVEVLYTCMLCFVVMNVAATKKNTPNQYFGLAIGFVIVAGGYAGGPVSGGAFNPAVAFGIDLSSAGLGFGWSFAYLAFELLGACLASGLYRICRPEEFTLNKESGLKEKLTSEFLGTYYLVLTVGLNVMGGSPAAAWSIAASLMCMIYALGSCSGAHFNPAVTLAIFLSGRNKVSGAGEMVAYMGTQILGGILAALTYTAIYRDSFPLAPGKDYGYAACGVAEVVFTFVLCYVVLCVATVKDASKDMFGLAIGSCVTVGGYAIGAVSGGSLNPAVSFGIDCASLMQNGIWNCFLYSAFEFIGAGLAAGAFHATHPGEFTKGAAAFAAKGAPQGSDEETEKLLDA